MRQKLTAIAFGLAIGLVFLELFSLVCFDSRCHFNERGNQILADFIAEAILKNWGS